MAWQLNKRALEHAKALVRSGKYEDRAWSFTADDSNGLLGPKGKENWPSYAMWFLGKDESANKATKGAYGYPFGKGEKVNLSALRAIISRAGSSGDGAIQDAARELLDAAKGKDADRASATGDASAGGACDLYMTGTVDIQADLTGPTDAGGQPALHRFHMDAYNGGAMMLKGGRKDIDYSKPIVVDLSGMSGIDRSRPALHNHDPAKPVGHTESIVIAAGALTADGVISNPDSPQGREIITSGKNRFPWQASIGANILAHEFVPAGKTGQANGRTFQGPLTIARRTRLGEISFVALGADDSTSAVIASREGASQSEQEYSNMAKQGFKAWAKAHGFKDDELEGARLKACRAMYRASAEYDAEDEDGKDPEGDGDDGKDKKGGKDGEGKAKKKDAEGARCDLDIAASASGGSAGDDGGADIRAEAVRIEKVKSAFDIQASRAGVGEKARDELAKAKIKAIDEKWSERDSVREAELITLRASRGPVEGAENRAFNILSGGRSQQEQAIREGVSLEDIIASAACMSTGMPEDQALTSRAKGQIEGTKFPEAAGNMALSGRVAGVDLRGIGLQGILGIAASMHGIHVPPGPMTDATLSRIMRQERRLDILEGQDDYGLRAAGGQDGYSTVSLLGITENIMNKMMLQSYGDVDSNVEDIAWQHDTNDFKIFKAYRMTASGRMQLVNDSGELRSIGLQDESYPNQLQTRGCVITVSRQTIINDDLGVLTDQPKALGREGAMTREEVTFTTFLSGMPTVGAQTPGASVGSPANTNVFYSTGNGNYLSGSTSALSISALSSAVQLFRQQRDANKRPIKLKPDRLLVPPALEEVAKRIFDGTGLVVSALGSTAAKQLEANLNTWKNAYRPVVSEFLASYGGTGLTGASDTAWWLLGNPSGGFAPVQIGYLRGQRTPIIERGEAPFSTLGMHMRCYYDFGVALHDFRSAVASAGA